MSTRRVAKSCIGLPLFAVIHSQVVLAQGDNRRPNIVLILSDDEDLSIHSYMPNVKRLIEDEGVTFDNAFATYPLCCPSRSSILRGQYPHNTKVLGNLPPRGGFKVMRVLGRERSTIATWLQGAGYRTAFYGKYLNGYTEYDAPPPGWDEWHAANNRGYIHFDYHLNENGHVVAYGDAPEDYLTDVIARKAQAHIRQFAAEGRPFFLYVATFAPHSPYTPAPRHADLFRDAPLPRPAAFNEADVSDKPTSIKRLPMLSGKDIQRMTSHHRNRLASLQAVDELVASLVQTLDEQQELDHTYIVYASDNGFHMGLHRMQEGKDTAHEEDIRIPLAVRGPGVPKGQRIDAMVLNIDFAPTFAAMAGVRPPGFVDGRSFLPLFERPDLPWRQSFMIQRLGIESDERLEVENALAIRTPKWIYVAYNNGEEELYDLERDPDQLNNLRGEADAALVDALTTRLIQLRACAGKACRTIEDSLFTE